MVLREQQFMTAETFHEWITIPENTDKSFELIAGELYEMVSTWNSSEIAMLIGSFVTQYVLREGLGKVTGADGGYIVGEDRYIPDVAFVRTDRLTDAPRIDGYYPVAPDLAIEVLSPTDAPRKVRAKVLNYLQAGTTVWLIDPVDRLVEVYVPGKPAVLLDVTGTLNGGEVLPGFSLPVNQFLG